MRAFYKPSTMFEHMKLPSWQKDGCVTVRQKARDRIKRALAQPHFELDSARTRDLNRIYAAAEKALA